MGKPVGSIAGPNDGLNDGCSVGNNVVGSVVGDTVPSDGEAKVGSVLGSSVGDTEGFVVGFTSTGIVVGDTVWVGKLVGSNVSALTDPADESDVDPNAIDPIDTEGIDTVDKSALTIVDWLNKDPAEENDSSTDFVPLPVGAVVAEKATGAFVGSTEEKTVGALVGADVAGSVDWNKEEVEPNVTDSIGTEGTDKVDNTVLTDDEESFNEELPDKNDMTMDFVDVTTGILREPIPPDWAPILPTVFDNSDKVEIIEMLPINVDGREAATLGTATEPALNAPLTATDTDSVLLADSFDECGIFCEPVATEGATDRPEKLFTDWKRGVDESDPTETVDGDEVEPTRADAVDGTEAAEIIDTLADISDVVEAVETADTLADMKEACDIEERVLISLTGELLEWVVEAPPIWLTTADIVLCESCDNTLTRNDWPLAIDTLPLTGEADVVLIILTALLTVLLTTADEDADDEGDADTGAEVDMWIWLTTPDIMLEAALNDVWIWLTTADIILSESVCVWDTLALTASDTALEIVDMAALFIALTIWLPDDEDPTDIGKMLVDVRIWLTTADDVLGKPLTATDDITCDTLPLLASNDWLFTPNDIEIRPEGSVIDGDSAETACDTAMLVVPLTGIKEIEEAVDIISDTSVDLETAALADRNAETVPDTGVKLVLADPDWAFDTAALVAMDWLFSPNDSEIMPDVAGLDTTLLVCIELTAEKVLNWDIGVDGPMLGDAVGAETCAKEPLWKAEPTRMLKEEPTETATKLVDAPTETGNKLVDAAPDTGNKLMDAPVETGTKLVDATAETGVKLVDAPTETGNKLVDAVPETGNKLVDAPVETGTKLVDANAETGVKLEDAAPETGNKLVDVATETGSKLVEAATETGTRLVDQRPETGNKLVDVATETGSKLADGVVLTGNKLAESTTDTRGRLADVISLTRGRLVDVISLTRGRLVDVISLTRGRLADSIWLTLGKDSDVSWETRARDSDKVAETRGSDPLVWVVDNFANDTGNDCATSWNESDTCVDGVPTTESSVLTWPRMTAPLKWFHRSSRFKMSTCPLIPPLLKTTAITVNTVHPKNRGRIMRHNIDDATSARNDNILTQPNQ
jgi:hypothetical protein